MNTNLPTPPTSPTRTGRTRRSIRRLTYGAAPTPSKQPPPLFEEDEEPDITSARAEHEQTQKRLPTGSKVAMHINSANGGQYSFSGTETNPKAKFILFLKGIRQSLRDYSDEFIPLMKIPNLDSPTEHPLTQGYDPRMNKLLYTVLWHLLRVPARLVLDDEDIEETADGRMAMLRLYSMYCEAGETELADVTSQMTDLHFTLEPKDEPQTTIREIERLHREYCTLSCQPWTDGAAITATLMTLNTGYTWLRRDVDRGVIPNLHELQREIVKHHQAHKSANDAATRRQMATTRHSVALAAAEARIQSLESDVAARRCPPSCGPTTFPLFLTMSHQSALRGRAGMRRQ